MVSESWVVATVLEVAEFCIEYKSDHVKLTRKLFQYYSCQSFLTCHLLVSAFRALFRSENERNSSHQRDHVVRDIASEAQKNKLSCEWCQTPSIVIDMFALARGVEYNKTMAAQFFRGGQGLELRSSGVVIPLSSECGHFGKVHDDAVIKLESTFGL